MKSFREFLRLSFRLYDYRILLATTLVWLVIYLFPEGNVPDYFNLKRTIEAGTFTRTLQSFIATFGFLVTILILGYGFLRERFRRLALKEFLKNRYSVVLASSFISVLIFNIISSVYIDSHDFSHTCLNFAYCSLIISITYFIAFLPLALFSIANTDSQFPIQEYLNELRAEHFPKKPSKEFIIEHDETNPIIVLSNISRVFIDKDDHHSVSTLILLSQQRIDGLIGNSKDSDIVRSYLTGQKIIWESIVNKAIQKKEYKILEKIFLSIRIYHYQFAQKKIPLLYLEELTFFIHNTTERLVKENIGDAVERLILDFEQILEHHYENSVPNEKEIWDLMDYYQQNPAPKDHFQDRSQAHLIDAQWDQISSNIPYIFSIILSNSIETKNITIFERTLSAMTHLITVAQISNMGLFQKAWVIRELLDDLNYYQIQGFKRGVLKDTYHVEWINTSDMTSIIDDNAFYKKDILESTSRFFIELMSLEKLHPETINFMSSIGRHCANSLAKAAHYIEILEYILKVFIYLKTEIELDKQKNVDSYEALRTGIESFIKFQKMSRIRGWQEGMSLENQNIDNDLIEKLESLLKEFSAKKPLKPHTISW